MRSRPAPSTYAAPPAGPDAAGPRPDLRGYRLGSAALISRPYEQLKAKRVHGLVGGFVAGLVVGIALLLAAVPDAVAVLAAAGTNFAVTLWLPTMLLAPADRRLLGVVNRSAAASFLGWRRAYGKAPIPRTEEEQLLWIAAQPDTTTNPDAISIEGSVLLLLGRYEAARDRAGRLPDDTPWWRFDRALGFAAIEFESGGPGDLTDARAAAEAVHGERRPLALVTLALEEAVRAMIRGDDWDPPIARAAATVRSPLSFGIVSALAGAGTRAILPWLLVSELALGAVLYLAVARVIA